MKKNSVNIIEFIMCTYSIFLVLTFGMLSISVNAVKYDPVAFNNIPIAKISSDNAEYKIKADFSIDYGDETAIEKNSDTQSINIIQLTKEVNGSSIELECDSNDRCGTSLAPQSISIYLVNSDVNQDQIVNSSIPTLQIADNDCGNMSIEDCANFDFSIPSDILVQNYSIVLDMSFDEAKWIFVNPVTISN